MLTWHAALLLALFPLTAGAGGEGRSRDPDPARGKKDKSGRTVCEFVTRAVKDGKEVDVPYEADFWLPPGYETETGRRYPVLYVLQNMDVPRRELAEMIRRGQFPPFIVVHVGGITQPLNRGEGGVWSDSHGPSGTIFREEFLPWVGRHFRCVPGPKGRVLVGCSKAGGAVMHLGLNYPDLFSAVVSADGAMRLYDVGGKDGNYYEKNKLRFRDALVRHGDDARDLPALMLLGSMFGAAGEDDDYLTGLRAAGMRDLEFQDCRHLGHDCGAMTAASFPEVMATFYNGVGDFAPWKPSVSPRGSVQAGPFDAAVRLAEPGWTARYTLDGSDPHQGGRPASATIHIDRSCWLRVIGVSPDGSRQSRETLARYAIEAPLPTAAPGKEPGLLPRSYEGGPGKNLTGFLADIQAGVRKPSPGKAAGAVGLLTYSGTLTVPAAGVWEFEIAWRGGLFFPQPGGPPDAVGRMSPGIAAVTVPLEKGSHPILLAVVGGGRDGPPNLRVRQPGGSFKPVPPEWFRH